MTEILIRVWTLMMHQQANVNIDTVVFKVGSLKVILALPSTTGTLSLTSWSQYDQTNEYALEAKEACQQRM